MRSACAKSVAHTYTSSPIYLNAHKHTVKETRACSARVPLFCSPTATICRRVVAPGRSSQREPMWARERKDDPPYSSSTSLDGPLYASPSFCSLFASPRDRPSAHDLWLTLGRAPAAGSHTRCRGPRAPDVTSRWGPLARFVRLLALSRARYVRMMLCYLVHRQLEGDPPISHVALSINVRERGGGYTISSRFSLLLPRTNDRAVICITTRSTHTQIHTPSYAITRLR